MTRRKFIQKLITAGSVMIAGTCWLVRKAAPRKFVRAFRVKKYPGSLRPLPPMLSADRHPVDCKSKNGGKQSKWSG